MLVYCLAPIVWCGAGGFMLSVHMDVAKRRVNAEVMQSYASVSSGRYESIRAEWMRGPKSIETFKALDRRYGRPLSWQIRKTFVDLAGSTFQGEVLVKRELIDTIESFTFGGMHGIETPLAIHWQDDAPGESLITEGDTLTLAKPVFHELDWAMKIKTVTAEKIGEEWRVTCKGTESGRLQTRFLIVSSQGQLIEHVRAHLADYPPEMIRQ